MPPEVIFFDAAGTLIRLKESVGETYARLAAEFGVEVEPGHVTTAFRGAWKSLPPPLHDLPPADDDQGWWHTMVERTFAIAVGERLEPAVLEPLFDALYRHYARPEAWELFEDVHLALDRFQAKARLFVLSNFDRRLRGILEGHGLTAHFEGMIISSEVGASKPHPRIFRAALEHARVGAGRCLHVGDDEKADAGGAAGQGIACHLVRRPGAGLLDLAEKLYSD